MTCFDDLKQFFHICNDDAKSLFETVAVRNVGGSIILMIVHTFSSKCSFTSIR